MAIYTEYLDAHLDLGQLAAERKRQLQRISNHRKRDVLVFAADTSAHLRNKGNVAVATLISLPDVLPVTDQLSKLSGSSLDLVLETPGGFGEIAEQIVRLLRARYQSCLPRRKWLFLNGDRDHAPARLPDRL